MRSFRSENPTVADLLACKGKRPLTQIFVRTVEEAAAAGAAGIEMVNLADSTWAPAYRKAAPRSFITVGLTWGMYATADDYLRAAFSIMNACADAVYCA